jgi:hypothetical protein
MEERGWATRLSIELACGKVKERQNIKTSERQKVEKRDPALRSG